MIFPIGSALFFIQTDAKSKRNEHYFYNQAGNKASSEFAHIKSNTNIKKVIENIKFWHTSFIYLTEGSNEWSVSFFFKPNSEKRIDSILFFFKKRTLTLDVRQFKWQDSAWQQYWTKILWASLHCSTVSLHLLQDELSLLRGEPPLLQGDNSPLYVDQASTASKWDSNQDKPKDIR